MHRDGARGEASTDLNSPQPTVRGSTRDLWRFNGALLRKCGLPLHELVAADQAPAQVDAQLAERQAAAGYPHQSDVGCTTFLLFAFQQRRCQSRAPKVEKRLLAAGLDVKERLRLLPVKRSN